MNRLSNIIIRGLALGLVGLGLASMGYNAETLAWWCVIFGLSLYVNFHKTG